MRAVRVALLVLCVALAGCDHRQGDGDGTESSTSTTTAAPPLRASLLADRVNGTAPLQVNFTLEATAGALEWRLSFGDGGLANGTGQPPAVANHSYAATGNFSAVLDVTYGWGHALANASIAVTLADASPLPPTHFEYGESFGCAPEGSRVEEGPVSCTSFLGGPAATGIDGHWLALDERYWGLHLTSVTVQNPMGPNDVPQFGQVGADSDCIFVGGDAETILGKANNGTRSCDGLVLEGAAFLFIYPYAAPALSITIDFVTA